MLSIDWRLRIRHWFRKYKKIIFIIVIVWAIIFLINTFLGDYTIKDKPQTSYTPSVSVLDDSSSVPQKTHLEAEEMIDEYVGYCNEGNYQKAFNMLTEDCRKYAFEDDVETFSKYVLTKMPTEKEYSIQNYSNYGDYYIYEIKYIDDILATGLTDQVYNYSTEKIVISKNSDGTYNMSTGNFISYQKVNSVVENDYLKIDIKDRLIRYSLETYEIRFTNRTDNTIVIQDTLGENEVSLVLSGEYRDTADADTRIILEPGDSVTTKLSFTKFADDGDSVQGILFGSVRVMEDYKGQDGTEEEQQAEIDNAIAKFSVQVPIR